MNDVATQAPDPTPSKESILASLESQPDEEATAAPAEAVESDEDESDADAPAEDEESEVEAAADDDADDSDEDAPPEDQKTQKGLDAVRRAEKRHREQMTADRAEFAREQSRWADKVSKLDEYEALAKRAKYDPIPVLKALGLTEDDFEMAAHAIFAESKTGATDPARKAAAANRLREREKEDKLTATERRMAELEKKIENDKIERENAAHAERYIGEINSAAKAKFPLVAHMMTATPEDVADGLSAAFDRLKAKTGKEPRPSEVVAEMDRKERTRLKALSVDVDALIKAKPANGNKPVAKINGTAKPANANVARTREEILAELDAL